MKLINNFKLCKAWSRIFRSVSCSGSFQRFSTQSEILEESPWESVVGLEIHAQVQAQSKLFSSAATDFNASTNSQVSFFDAALPGTLPVCNKHCVEAGVLTALALNCTIHETSFFDRKHYFYSDLPAGYQITQQFLPLASNGYIEFFVPHSAPNTDPYKCRVRLKQLQLEQDSGRSLHLQQQRTLIDLNRAGIGLMELVFEPDLHNGIEASMLVKELQLILRKLKTCSCAMDEGALRVDANISVHKRGMPYGVRTEVKNINSNKYIQEAVDYEIQRQIEVIESGQIVFNETRSFDFKARKTLSMRDKEEHQDYRFLPEPNLLPIQVRLEGEDNQAPNEVSVPFLKKTMPRLLQEERHLLTTVHKLSVKNCERILKYEGLVDLYDVISPPIESQDRVVTFLLNNLKHQLNLKKQTFETCEINPHQVKEVVELIENAVITEAVSNNILEMLFNGDKRSAREIVDTYNWSLIKDEDVLAELCQNVLKERNKVAKKYKNTQRTRYLTPLLICLNAKSNNRVLLKDAVATFRKLLDIQNNPTE